MGGSWGDLGVSWGHLGYLGGILWVSWGDPGGSWRDLGLFFRAFGSRVAVLFMGGETWAACSCLSSVSSRPVSPLLSIIELSSQLVALNLFWQLPVNEARSQAAKHCLPHQLFPGGGHPQEETMGNFFMFFGSVNATRCQTLLNYTSNSFQGRAPRRKLCEFFSSFFDAISVNTTRCQKLPNCTSNSFQGAGTPEETMCNFFQFFFCAFSMKLFPGGGHPGGNYGQLFPVFFGAFSVNTTRCQTYIAKLHQQLFPGGGPPGGNYVQFFPVFLMRSR